MSKEAMKLALEAFSVIAISDNLDWIRHQAKQQAIYLREALAQERSSDEQPAPVPEAHEQEPVAIADGTFNHNCPVGTPLYTSPPTLSLVQRKPLTDELLRKMHHEDQFGLFCDYDEFEQIARAIEAKLRLKNGGPA